MKMKYCSYCGSRLDETTGVCPKCYGGMDAPKQEEQMSELTSVPKVDLGDSPFASAPSTVIPTLTLDPFGNSAAQGSGSQVQLEFGSASEPAQVNASGPQLVMPEVQTPSPVQTGSGITLELKPGVSVEPEKPTPEATALEKVSAPMQPETSAQPESSTMDQTDVFTQTPPAYSPKAQTKFEEMVAKIQAEQERMKQEQPIEPQQGSQQAFPTSGVAQEVQQAQQAQQPTTLRAQYLQAKQQPQQQQPGVPQPMQAPQSSMKEAVPQPMQAPSYGQARPQQAGQYVQPQATQYTQPQATQYTQAQTAQNAQYGQQAPVYGQQYGQPQGGQYGQQAPVYGQQYGQPQGGQYGQQNPAYGQQYGQPQAGQYTQQSAPYGMAAGAASAEAVNAYMKSQKPANYANPAYVDQEVTYDTQYAQPVDPRFSQTVNMNMQYNQGQVPVLYQQQNMAYTPGAPIASIESKSRTTAAVLAILLGHLGIHKFYLNSPTAIWYLLITLLSCGLGGVVMWIISLVEGIGYLGMTDEEFKQKLYEEFYKNNQ